MLALAVAVNAVSTPLDLLVWHSVFSRLGSAVLPGGKYVRPFVAGTVPYVVALPVMLVALNLSFRTIAQLFLK